MSVTARQIVCHRYVITVLEQQIYSVGADITTAASHQDSLHKSSRINRKYSRPLLSTLALTIHGPRIGGKHEFAARTHFRSRERRRRSVIYCPSVHLTI